jgi:hypothetical protein
MGRRIARDHRPGFEQCERRDLLSGITDVMAGNSIAANMRALATAAAKSASNPSIAIPTNQGPLLNPDGTINNAALAPTGNLTNREFRREQFKARYVGTYTVGAGRTSTEKNEVFITGAGSANTIRHSDIQLLMVTPIDPSSPVGGVASIFDRNINTNTGLGLDLAAPQTSPAIGRNGLPVLLSKVSIDANISSGTYVEGFSVGTVKIHYIPSGKRTPGVLGQGKAIVTIHAQIYTANTSFILRNSHINPGA